MRSFSPLMWIGATFAFFFPEIRKCLLKFTVFEYDGECFTILLSHSFNSLMDTSWCPWVLVMSSVLIILCISSSSISEDDNFVSVISVWLSSNLLSYGKGLHWRKMFVKKI